MKVIIRADASIHIGSGHIMRCLVLAESLSNKGYSVAFACRPQTGDLIDFILSCHIEVIHLNSVIENTPPQHNADYIGWLQRSIQDDADDFLNKIDQADIVITDHYAIGCEWQRQIKAALGCKIVAIDDLMRKHEADVLIDQTLGREAQDYSNVKRVLAGSRYSVLKPNFSMLREKAYDRSVPKSRVRVLVSMGGIDSPNATLAVVKTLSNQSNITLTVLLSSRAPHYSSVTSYCATQSNVEHIDFVEDMASLMLQHDIAIGAPGTTSWERACLGLPNIIIPLAENQRTICQRLVEFKASIAVELSQIESELKGAYQTLQSDWSAYYQANLKVCDGLGLYRILKEIDLLTCSECNGYHLLFARQADIGLVYQWQSEPLTRQFALNPNPPTWEEHAEWMSNKINNNYQDYFYLITSIDSQKKMGVVRLDRQYAGHYLISIFVDPNCYGKGVAQAALSLIDKLHPHVTLHATVLANNAASQRLFEKAHYQKITIDEFTRYPIK